MKERVKTIQSVQRAIDILNCVGDTGRKISLHEISAKLDLNINTTRGLVQTLLANRLLSKDANLGAYTLGSEFLTKSKLVYRFQVQRVREAARPHMESISKRFDIGIWLQIVFYRDIYTVDTVHAPGGYYSYAPRTDAKLPLHASASGKLRIAFMPEKEREKVIAGLALDKLTEHTITDREDFIREMKCVYEQGYSTEIDEMDAGIASVGAPLFDIFGNLSGTMSVVTLSAKLQRILDDVTRELTQACAQISDVISGRAC